MTRSEFDQLAMANKASASSGGATDFRHSESFDRGSAFRGPVVADPIADMTIMAAS